MNIVKILLTCLLCVNTFNVAPVFAEEGDQPEETVMVDEVLQEEADAVETTVIEEEVTPEITVLDGEVVPVETNEIEEFQVEELSEEVILTEEDIPEENIEEELSSEEIIEVTPEPTVEPTPEVILETTPEIVTEEVVESTPIPTLETTPEPTATPEVEEELEEMEEISEEEVVEEVVEEEALVNAMWTYDDQGLGEKFEGKKVTDKSGKSHFEYNITPSNINNEQKYKLESQGDSEQLHIIYVDVTKEDLKGGARKYLNFWINNQTQGVAEYALIHPDNHFMHGSWKNDNNPDYKEFLPGMAPGYCDSVDVGKYYIKIKTYSKGSIRFSFSIGDDDYGDDYDDADDIVAGKTYNGKLNYTDDIDMLQFTAKESGKLKVTLSKIGEIAGFVDLTVKDKNELWAWDPLCMIMVGKSDSQFWNYKDYGSTITKTMNVEKGKTYSFKIRTILYDENGSNYSLKLDFVEAPKMPKVEATAIYNSAHGVDIRWKPINGVRYYGIWRKRTNPVTKVLEEEIVQLIDTNTYKTKDGGNYKWIDSYLKDKYTDKGKEWEGGWVYYVTARSTSNTNLSYNDGKHLTIDGPISNKLNLYRLRNPEIKSVKANGNGKVTVTWNNVPTAHAYEVQYTLDSGKTWTKVPEVIAAYWGPDGREVKVPGYKPTVTISNLPKGKKVNFRIRCRKTNTSLGDTWSEYSPWRSTTVK